MSKSTGEKTASTLHHGLNPFTGMRCGVHNAHDTFQHIMDVVQSAVEQPYALLYEYDIVIFLRILDKNIKHTGMFLRLLKDGGVTS